MSDTSSPKCPVPKDSLLYKLFTKKSQEEEISESRCPCSCDRLEKNLPEHEYSDDDLDSGLSKQSVVSSIPRLGKNSKPDDKWVYPSPHKFHCAMKRKGWKHPKDNMDTIVAIHNSINERVWKEILKYESMHKDEYDPKSAYGDQPRLVIFRGRPKDLSPKARFLMYMYGYQKPFDRHDWIVDRNGKRVRYVIDFYNGQTIDDIKTGVYLDVRPALTFGGAWDRLKMQYNIMMQRFARRTQESSQ